ncbi:MAG: hypothetical protein LC437_04705 [Thiohalomonas sp.]|nr:hypothetical protein [Thiohalomonas sp.]
MGIQSCYAPLLTTPWILDVDVTLKPLYPQSKYPLSEKLSAIIRQW